MDSSTIIATHTPTLDRQTFGAAVVSKTLDYMNNTSSGTTPAPTDKESFGAAVVSKTLDYMNSSDHHHSAKNAMEHSYDFNKDVLGGHYSAVGALVDKTG